jgi:hypothetical protein
LGFRQNSAKAAEEGKSACGKSLIPNSAHKFEGFLVVGSKNGDTLSLFEPKSEIHAGREELLEQERGSDPDVRLWESCVEAGGGGTRLTLHAACRGFECLTGQFILLSSAYNPAVVALASTNSVTFSTPTRCFNSNQFSVQRRHTDGCSKLHSLFCFGKILRTDQY